MKLDLTDSDRAQLAEMARADDSSSERAKILLLAASGLSDSAVARTVGTTRQRVSRWKRRYLESATTGLHTLADAPRTGRPRTADSAVLFATARPSPGGVGWSTAQIAQQTGFSTATVRAVWQRWGVDSESQSSQTAVLRGETHALVATHANGPDAAIVTWRSRGSTSQPDLTAPQGLQDWSRRLSTAAEQVDLAECFPLQAYAVFDEMMESVCDATPKTMDVWVMVKRRQMTERSYVERWSHHPGIEIRLAPLEPWEDYLTGVFSGLAGDRNALDLIDDLLGHLNVLAQGPAVSVTHFPTS